MTIETRWCAAGAALMAALSAGCSSSSDAPDDEGAGGGGGAPGCAAHADCGGTPETPYCNPDTEACESLPAGHPIGWGDGSVGSVDIVPIYTPPSNFGPLEAPDLQFHPQRTNELWVLHRSPCDTSNVNLTGCTLGGRIGVVWNPGTASQGSQIYMDPNAWHFMRLPPALAFGENGWFATVGEARTGNNLSDPVDYIGPTLWSGALPGVVVGCETSAEGCFSVQPAGGNGSHLDMLHASPWAMGIAHEQANTYWVFNGDIGSLDRYRFKNPHEPGGEDHSDGEIYRYAVGQLTRVPGVPSHMVFDKTAWQLYVADTGGARVVRLDPNSGTPSGSASPVYEQYEINQQIEGALLTDVIAPGILQAPSGLELHEGVLYVTDNANGRIHAFDPATGEELRFLDTGFPPGALAGFTIGPDGKAYFVDEPNGGVFRIDPR